MDFSIIIGGVAVFTGVIMLLVIGLMWVANFFSPGGSVKVDINEGHKVLDVEPGDTLLNTLAAQKVFVPSACGGGGSCGMCTCKVHEGGGDILPTELGHIKKAERREGARLACQVKVRQDMKIELPEEVLDVQKWECEVVSNRNVATFIKEFTVKLPEGENLDFKAGGYIQLDIPEYEVAYKDYNIDEEYRGDWEKFGLFDLVSKNEEPIFRAYSMANHPAEGNIVTLNVRIATPPPGSNFPPGISSSYIFSLKAGDKINVSGPYGDFFMSDSGKEICFVGGGAGMAPMRSHIFDLFKTKGTNRKATFWYGARSLREVFYEEDFNKIAAENENFEWNLALSDPQPEDNWDGYTGFIHNVLLMEYLDKHKDPTEIEYYLCGPPMMLGALKKMFYDIGVELDNVFFDEF